MTIADLILIGLFGAACYFFGKVSMANSIVKELLKEAEDENTSENKPASNIGKLFVEKVNGCYYAYVDQEFVGQAANFTDLFTNIKNRKGNNSFTVSTDGLDTLSSAEQDSMIKAITEVFGSK